VAVRVYKLKAFGEFQRRERIADKALAKAIRDAESGLIDADLGGGQAGGSRGLDKVSAEATAK
jgi:hypothetical protein